jgi:predicted ribosome quality control (RQC) complex YloA/Tae2 family protein
LVGDGVASGGQPPPSDPHAGIYQGRRVARLYSSPSGLTVLVGRTAEENDILSLKLARPRDVFFHVSSQPGSHVIVLVPDAIDELDRDTVRFAASLAAAWSSARGARQVDVHYASCADVSKRRGQPPGEVMLRDWKSVRVAPDRQEAWRRHAGGAVPAGDADTR